MKSKVVLDLSFCPLDDLELDLGKVTKLCCMYFLHDPHFEGFSSKLYLANLNAICLCCDVMLFYLTFVRYLALWIRKMNRSLYKELHWCSRVILWLVAWHYPVEWPWQANMVAPPPRDARKFMCCKFHAMISMRRGPAILTHPLTWCLHNLENMISTYTKEFSWEKKWPKFARFWRKIIPNG